MENKHSLQTIVFTVFLLLAPWIVLAPSGIGPDTIL